MEGLSLAGNFQGVPADALIALFKMKSIHYVLKWVNDFIFFHISPTPHPSLDIAMTSFLYYPSWTHWVSCGTLSRPKANTLSLW